MDILTAFDWASWWASVTPEFALLVVLPFVVGMTGLLATRRKTRTD